MKKRIFSCFWLWYCCWRYSLQEMPSPTNMSMPTESPLILNIPLTASGVKERNQMESFRMNFANVKNGKVTLDYIFIGPSELAPN